MTSSECASRKHLWPTTTKREVSRGPHLLRRAAAAFSDTKGRINLQSAMVTAAANFQNRRSGCSSRPRHFTVHKSMRVSKSSNTWLLQYEYLPPPQFDSCLGCVIRVWEPPRIGTTCFGISELAYRLFRGEAFLELATIINSSSGAKGPLNTVQDLIQL